MNNLEISTNPALLNTSPSVSTFLHEEDASTCPLLPTTPSPPPMHFNHPLTPNALNENCAQPSDDGGTADDNRAEEETSSCSGSSGIGMDGQVVAGTTTVFNQNVYQHFGNNVEAIPESETKLHAHLNVPDSKDVPSFVYWNWKLIRRCSFICFLAGVVAMIAIVVSMIYSLPRTCNPKTVWYDGSVFYEIYPTSFQDSNGDGIGDLRGLTSRADYLTKLGVVGVRLNSIFPSKNHPDHYQNVTTLLAIDDVLGTPQDLEQLTRSFHRNNLSLILDLPIYPHLTQLNPVEKFVEENLKSPVNVDEGTLRIARESNEKNAVIQALNLWLKYGIDGFYIKGLENLHQDPNLLDNIRMWKSILGPHRILMVNKELLQNVDVTLAKQLIKHIDMVDIVVDVTNGTKQIANQINQNLNGLLKPGDGPYIQWSLGGVSEHHKSYGLTSNATLAATLMSLMLPGSPNVYYGDETSSQESRDHFSESVDAKHSHQLSSMAWNTVPELMDPATLHRTSPRSATLSFDNFDTIASMIALRDVSPSIYKNVIQKKGKIESNTSAMYHEKGNILILMRWYPRRNTFVSISNFGEKIVTLDLTNFFYSGQIIIGGPTHEKIYFNQFEIGPIKTIIIKLDK